MRSVWIFLAAFFGAAAPDYLTLRFSENWGIGRTIEHSLIVGIIAAVAAAAVRGGVEGLTDSARQRAGDVKASDVQPGSAGKA